MTKDENDEPEVFSGWIDFTQPAAKAGSDLTRIAQSVVEQASDYYTARNGKRMSIEGDDGEKCWIVPFDAFEELRAALAASPPKVESALSRLIALCDEVETWDAAMLAEFRSTDPVKRLAEMLSTPAPVESGVVEKERAKLIRDLQRGARREHDADDHRGTTNWDLMNRALLALASSKEERVSEAMLIAGVQAMFDSPGPDGGVDVEAIYKAMCAAQVGGERP